MKYIDAEKLVAEIERRREKCADVAADERNEEVAEYYRGKEVAYGETSGLITSLPQEQPVLPGIEEHGIPGKDFIPVEWVDTCEMYGKWKIVKQDQPEVDLEKLGGIARHIIAVKQHIEDMRLDEGEWLLLERIGYPERYNARKEE